MSLHQHYIYEGHFPVAEQRHNFIPFDFKIYNVFLPMKGFYVKI